MTKTTTETIAEVVSEAMCSDGTRFAYQGRTLDAVARLHGASISRTDTMTRYEFPDGSSIIDAGGGWDLGISLDCWCWAGAGHSADCEQRRAERGTP
jgi:hypothetical protein